MDIALDLMINEEIRDREVRLIDENGEQLGVMPTAKAMELAEERGGDEWRETVRRFAKATLVNKAEQNRKLHRTLSPNR